MPGAQSIRAVTSKIAKKDASSDHILVLEAGTMVGKCKERGDSIKSKQARDATRNPSIGQSRA